MHLFQDTMHDYQFWVLEYEHDEKVSYAYGHIEHGVLYKDVYW